MSSPAEAEGVVNISIREDRELKKKVVIRGDYRVFPSEGARVRVKISKVVFNDGSRQCDVDPLSRYFRNDFNGRLEMGEADYYLDEDLERCLESMSKGEASLLTMQYCNLEGEVALHVTCRVKVLESSQEEPISEWEWTRLLAASTRNKNRGVELVAARRVADAFRRFAKAFKLIVAVEPYNSEKIPSARFADLMELKVKLLTNLAHCQLYFKDYDATIKICNKVLYMDDFNIKALYRRGAAHMGLEDWENAYSDMRLVLRLEPDCTEAQQKLTLIIPKMKQINSNYNNMVKKMFGHKDN